MKWFRCAAVIATLSTVACFAQAQDSSNRKVIENLALKKLDE